MPVSPPATWHRARSGRLGSSACRVLGQAAENEGVKFESTEDEQARRKQAIELIAAYCAQLPRNEPRPLAVEAAVEAPLVDPASGENLGIPLVGIMDLVLPDPEGPLIADFKTACAWRRAAGDHARGAADLVQLSVSPHVARDRRRLGNPQPCEDQSRQSRRRIAIRPAPIGISAGCSA